MEQGEPLHFIHFGCWNHGGCADDGENPLSLLMNKLRGFIKRKAPQFITIAGDNYYPHKQGKGDEKKKIIKLKELKSGFACLPKDIPIYLMLGNHDLETSKKMEIITESGESTTVDHCFILEKENEIIDSMNIIRPKNENRKLVMHKRVGNTLLLMLDTTMYDLDYNPGKPDKLDPTLLCYDKLLGLSEKTSTEESLSLLQKEEVEAIISEIDESTIKNIIIFGHHPLMFMKVKKGNLIESVLDKAYGLFYGVIFEKFKGNPNIKYYYLCADFHSYQVGNIKITSANHPDIEMVIHQEIVGTGGSILDDDFGYAKKKVTSIDINGLTVSYDIEKNGKKYGFLDCTVINDEVSFLFRTLLRSKHLATMATLNKKTLLLGGRKSRKVKPLKI